MQAREHKGVKTPIVGSEEPLTAKTTKTFPLTELRSLARSSNEKILAWEALVSPRQFNVSKVVKFSNSLDTEDLKGHQMIFKSIPITNDGADSPTSSSQLSDAGSMRWSQDSAATEQQKTWQRAVGVHSQTYGHFQEPGSGKLVSDDWYPSRHTSLMRGSSVGSASSQAGHATHHSPFSRRRADDPPKPRSRDRTTTHTPRTKQQSGQPASAAAKLRSVPSSPPPASLPIPMRILSPTKSPTKAQQQPSRAPRSISWSPGGWGPSPSGGFSKPAEKLTSGEARSFFLDRPSLPDAASDYRTVDAPMNVVTISQHIPEPTAKLRREPSPDAGAPVAAGGRAGGGEWYGQARVSEETQEEMAEARKMDSDEEYATPRFVGALSTMSSSRSSDGTAGTAASHAHAPASPRPHPGTPRTPRSSYVRSESVLMASARDIQELMAAEEEAFAAIRSSSNTPRAAHEVEDEDGLPPFDAGEDDAGSSSAGDDSRVLASARAEQESTPRGSPLLRRGFSAASLHSAAGSLHDCGTVGGAGPKDAGGRGDFVGYVEVDEERMNDLALLAAARAGEVTPNRAFTTRKPVVGGGLQGLRTAAVWSSPRREDGQVAGSGADKTPRKRTTPASVLDLRSPPSSTKTGEVDRLQMKMERLLEDVEVLRDLTHSTSQPQETRQAGRAAAQMTTEMGGAFSETDPVYSRVRELEARLLQRKLARVAEEAASGVRDQKLELYHQMGNRVLKQIALGDPVVEAQKLERLEAQLGAAGQQLEALMGEQDLKRVERWRAERQELWREAEARESLGMELFPAKPRSPHQYAYGSDFYETESKHLTPRTTTPRSMAGTPRGMHTPGGGTPGAHVALSGYPLAAVSGATSPLVTPRQAGTPRETFPRCLPPASPPEAAAQSADEGDWGQAAGEAPVGGGGPSSSVRASLDGGNGSSEDAAATAAQQSPVRVASPSPRKHPPPVLTRITAVDDEDENDEAEPRSPGSPLASPLSKSWTDLGRSEDDSSSALEEDEEQFPGDAPAQQPGAQFEAGHNEAGYCADEEGSVSGSEATGKKRQASVAKAAGGPPEMGPVAVALHPVGAVSPAQIVRQRMAVVEDGDPVPRKSGLCSCFG